MAQKTKPHKYRVSVYLGKELFDDLNGIANFLGIPLASLCKILLQTGKEFADSMERSFPNGGKKI